VLAPEVQAIADHEQILDIEADKLGRNIAVTNA